jgi:hypothetical protein
MRTILLTEDEFFQMKRLLESSCSQGKLDDLYFRQFYQNDEHPSKARDVDRFIPDDVKLCLRWGLRT